MDEKGMLYTLLGKLYPGKNIVDFTKTSLKAGKNNFYLDGSFNILNMSAVQIGHGYKVGVKSIGHGHLTSIKYDCESSWRNASKGRNGRYVIEWEPDYNKMVRSLFDLRGVIKGVADSVGVRSFVHVDIANNVQGTYPTRFDDEPTGFIS